MAGTGGGGGRGLEKLGTGFVAPTPPYHRNAAYATVQTLMCTFAHPLYQHAQLNIDPETLIPKLPKPRDLHPFPTACALVRNILACQDWLISPLVEMTRVPLFLAKVEPKSLRAALVEVFLVAAPVNIPHICQ